MNFHILTLFPEMISSGLNTSITGRAISNGLISVDCVNIRDYTDDPHGHVDDAPYGGGAGMVMQCQPVYDCYSDVLGRIAATQLVKFANERNMALSDVLESREFSEENFKKPRVIYTSPAGRLFNQKLARELANEEDLIILCGHYEGVDQRVLDLMEAEEVSIGDYVLTGGELAAMVMVDAVSRMVPGVLGNEDSGEDESFSSVNPSAEFTKKIRREVYGDLAGNDELVMLEYPQYTRPEDFKGMKVPEVLLSGDHAKVDRWRREQSLERTKKRRPDLLK